MPTRIAILPKSEVPALRAEMARAAKPDNFSLFRVSPAVARGVASEMLMRLYDWHKAHYVPLMPVVEALAESINGGDLLSIPIIFDRIEKDMPQHMEGLIGYLAHMAMISGAREMLSPLLEKTHPSEDDMQDIARRFNKMSLNPKFDVILNRAVTIAHFGRRHDMLTFVPDATCTHGPQPAETHRKTAIALTTICAQHYNETFGMYYHRLCRTQRQHEVVENAFQSMNDVFMQICDQLANQKPAARQAAIYPVPSAPEPANAAVGATILAFRPRR